MMDFAGHELLACEPREVWTRLTDTAFLCRVIPDLEHVDRIEERLLVCRVRPSLSFLSGVLTLTVDIVEGHSPDRAEMRIRARGIGAALLITTSICLVAHEQGTHVGWEAKLVEREGLLKPVSPSLIEAAAHQVIADAWRRFRQALVG